MHTSKDDVEAGSPPVGEPSEPIIVIGSDGKKRKRRRRKKKKESLSEAEETEVNTFPFTCCLKTTLIAPVSAVIFIIVGISLLTWLLMSGPTDRADSRSPRVRGGRGRFRGGWKSSEDDWDPILTLEALEVTEERDQSRESYQPSWLPQDSKDSFRDVGQECNVFAEEPQRRDLEQNNESYTGPALFCGLIGVLACIVKQFCPSRSDQEANVIAKTCCTVFVICVVVSLVTALVVMSVEQTGGDLSTIDTVEASGLNVAIDAEITIGDINIGVGELRSDNDIDIVTEVNDEKVYDQLSEDSVLSDSGIDIVSNVKDERVHVHDQKSADSVLYNNGIGIVTVVKDDRVFHHVNESGTTMYIQNFSKMSEQWYSIAQRYSISGVASQDFDVSEELIDFSASGASTAKVSAPNASKIVVEATGASKVTINAPVAQDIIVNASGNTRVIVRAPLAGRISGNTSGISKVQVLTNNSGGSGVQSRNIYSSGDSKMWISRA